MMKTTIKIFAGMILSSYAVSVAAEPTEIVVRVISQDAKFVGDSMGGANVVLRNANTGKVMAKGVTKGGTGDTRAIMEASGRSPLRSTPSAAAFSTQLDIAEPTLIDLEVSGPVARPGSSIRIVSQRWVLPGQAVNIGDGCVVELPGLAISPTAAITNTDPASGGSIVSIKAKVELMCGCPITPGGLWDAKDYGVEVSAWRGGTQVSAGALSFVESPGVFSGDLKVPGKGRYKPIVFARNAKTGNSGIAQIPAPTP